MSFSEDFGSWAGVRILTVQSVNSGLDSFGNSPTKSANGTVRIIQPTRTAAMARTSDWVQEQSSQDHTSAPEAVPHHAQPVTPPHRSISCNDNDDDNNQHRAGPSTDQNCSKLIYSIPSLLKLRHVQAAVPVMLRVKPEAIAGKCHEITTSCGFPYLGHSLTNSLQRISSSTWEQLLRIGSPLARAASLKFRTYHAAASAPSTILVIAHPSDQESGPFLK